MLGNGKAGPCDFFAARTASLSKGSEPLAPSLGLEADWVRGSGVSGFRVQGSGFRVQGSGFRVQGSGFRVQGSGFRVQGLGFRV